MFFPKPKLVLINQGMFMEKADYRFMDESFKNFIETV